MVGSSGSARDGHELLPEEAQTPLEKALAAGSKRGVAGGDQEGPGAGHRKQPEVPRALGAMAVPRCADRRVRDGEIGRAHV